jgi:DNA-binding response OmpR family regulator
LPTGGYISGVRVLLAMDVDWLVDDVVAALGGADTSFTVCSEGRLVSKQVATEARTGGAYDLAIVDLQIGSMGGVAVTMGLRLDASAGLVPEVPVLLLLDRVADVHLAKRCGADGWLIKPLDPLRLRRAARAIAAGSRYTEGLAERAEPGVSMRGGSLTIDPVLGVEATPVDEPAATEPATAG